MEILAHFRLFNFDLLDLTINSKQDSITSTSKLSSNLIDDSASVLRFVDISSNLQAQLDTLATQSGGNSIPSITSDSNLTTTTISDTTVVDTVTGKINGTTMKTLLSPCHSVLGCHRVSVRCCFKC
jgi:hypothetical protein